MRSSFLPALVLVAAAVVSLVALAYPSISVPVFRTDTIANTTTISSASWSTISTTMAGWVPYSTSTGGVIVYDYLCDPGSMACTPTKTYYTTQTLSTYEADTKISRVTMTTQWVSTNEFESTHTAYRQIPAYAAFGMNDPQFLMLAGFVILILVVGILVIFVRTRRVAIPRQAKPSQLKMERVFCINCGARLPSGSRFCGKCGTEQT